jgi:hypothetical protein
MREEEEPQTNLTQIDEEFKTLSGREEKKIETPLYFAIDRSK